jgi:hypothetical protein
MTPGTLEFHDEVSKVTIALFQFLALNKIHEEVAASALMIATSKLTAKSLESTDNIVGQFRKCLEEDRLTEQ